MNILELQYRMVNSTRRNKKSRKSSGVFRRVYSPLFHLLEATRNVGKSTFKRSGRVVDEALGLGQNVGSSVARHANQTVRNIMARKNRKSRKSRKNRR